jgi:phenylalanyl-tRNA synthetase beta chain
MFNFLKNLFSSTSPKKTSFNGIISAKVLAVEKHPNADRLQVVRLTDGTKEIYPVVCGAFNFKAGDIVALALPGATIPHNIHSDQHESFTLGTAKIRGIESQGMICAEFELGLSKTIGEGIMILPETTSVGIPLDKAL